MHTLTNAGTDYLTDCEQKLPARDDTTTELHRGDLGKVEGDSVGDDTNTTTEDEAADSEETENVSEVTCHKITYAELPTRIT